MTQKTPQRMLTHNFVVDKLIWPMPFSDIYLAQGNYGMLRINAIREFHFDKISVKILYSNSPLNGNHRIIQQY